MEVSFTIPSYAITILTCGFIGIISGLLYLGLIKLIVRMWRVRLGFWIWKAHIGLACRRNNYEGYALRRVLEDIEEKTGVRYVPEKEGENHE